MNSLKYLLALCSLSAPLFGGEALPQDAPRQITAVATRDGRLLVDRSIGLPRGVEVLPLVPGEGKGARAPLAIELVDGGSLPQPRPLSDAAREFFAAVAERRTEDSTSAPADCFAECSFVLEIHHPSGASSLFLFSRYRTTEQNRPADAVSAIAEFLPNGVTFTSSGTEASLPSSTDFSSCNPGGCRNFCFNPGSSTCSSLMWSGRFLPAQIDSSIFLASEGMQRARCPRNLSCPPEWEGVALSVAVHPY